MITTRQQNKEHDAAWNPWTVPNALTVLRLSLVPFFVTAFVQGRYVPAAVLFGVAGLSDGLDGLAARVLNQRSRLGALLDPIADKVLLDAAMLALGLSGWIPMSVALLVVARDACILTGLAALGFAGRLPVKPLSPTWASKINTVAQICLVLLVIGQHSGYVNPGFFPTALMAVIVVLTLFSSVQYGRRAWALWTRQ